MEKRIRKGVNEEREMARVAEKAEVWDLGVARK